MVTAQQALVLVSPSSRAVVGNALFPPTHLQVHPAVCKQSCSLSGSVLGRPLKFAQSNNSKQAAAHLRLLSTCTATEQWTGIQDVAPETSAAVMTPPASSSGMGAGI